MGRNLSLNVMMEIILMEMDAPWIVECNLGIIVVVAHLTLLIFVLYSSLQKLPCGRPDKFDIKQKS
jgi:hypothetical protein